MPGRRSRARAHGLAFASGLAAEDAILRAAGTGRRRGRLGDDAYGGTFRLDRQGPRTDGHGWQRRRPHRLRRAWPTAGPTAPRLVWVETPTNPAAAASSTSPRCAEIAHGRGALVVVDNTFATPYLQQPLALGADVVVHSTTKYLGGHSDVVGGFVATDDDGLGGALRFVQNAVGAVPSPFDCYLVQRGVKTLAVRMDRHCRQRRGGAEALVGHPLVDRVL